MVRGVNLRIRAAALRLDGLAAETRWDFLCECGAPDCMEFVRLPMARFEALVAAGGAVLAERHSGLLRRGAACDAPAHVPRATSA